MLKMICITMEIIVYFIIGLVLIPLDAIVWVFKYIADRGYNAVDNYKLDKRLRGK